MNGLLSSLYQIAENGIGFILFKSLFPQLGSAKPSNLRAKFENFAKVKEEEDSKRAAEQKRLREDKDRLDREQAFNSQKNGNESNDSDRQQLRTPIETGRTGSIGNAISIFNKVEDKPIAPVQRVRKQSP